MWNVTFPIHLYKLLDLYVLSTWRLILVICDLVHLCKSLQGERQQFGLFSLANAQ